MQKTHTQGPSHVFCSSCAIQITMLYTPRDLVLQRIDIAPFFLLCKHESSLLVSVLPICDVHNLRSRSRFFSHLLSNRIRSVRIITLLNDLYREEKEKKKGGYNIKEREKKCL